MAAVNCPTSPSNGDTISNAGITYTYRSTGTRWDVTGGSLPSQIPSGSSNPAVGGVGSLFYNTATAVLHISTGSAWGVVSGSGGSSVTVQETAPSSPSEGDLWFDPSDMVPYIYYNDGNSTQWVNFVSASGGGGSGSAITVQEEGTALATAADTFNFVGTGVTASGTGATKTITVIPPSNVATATALATARTIGGVSFDGSADINLPGVNAIGTQNTSGTAAIATGVTSGSSNPAVGAAGALFYNTSNSTMYTSDGSAWVAIGGLDAHDHVISTGGTVTIPTVEGTNSFNYNLGLNFADATSSDAQLTYTLESGSLPPNAVLPSSGNSAFTGTVSNTQAAATYTFAIRGTDPQGLFAIQNFTWAVTNNIPTSTGGTVVIAEQAPGANFSYNLGINFADATNTDGELTYTLESGTLPSGCALPSAGNSAFTGTATTSGSYSFVIRATDTSGLYVTQAYTQVIAVYVGVIAYEPTFSSPGYTTATSGTFAISNFTSLNNFTSSGGANQTIYVLMVGGGGGSQQQIQSNAASTSIWRFGGAGGGAFMLVGKAADFNGCSYTVGGAGPNSQGGNSWYGGYATASTFTINGTTYTTNFTTAATYSIATSDITASQCFPVYSGTSDWGQTATFNGTYFRWSGSGGIPSLTYTKPNTHSTIPTADQTFEGVWGNWDSGTFTSRANYHKDITFGGGRGAGNGTGGGTDLWGTSVFSGDGANPIGTNNPQTPGGGATQPSTMTNSDVANSFYGAPGSMRVYWENN